VLIAMMSCLGVGMAGGGCAPAAAALPVGPVPWADGETGVYVWVEAGAEIGAGTFEQRRTAGGWEIANRSVIGFFEHNGTVVADLETLLPRSSRVVVEGVPATYKVEAAYDADAGIAALRATTPQGIRELNVKLPRGHWVDNEQFLMTLRALPLALGFQMRVNLVNTTGGAVLPVGVEVRAQETIAIEVEGLDGREHLAWRVALMGGAQTAWYSVAKPHILLKYDNGQRVCVLREYRRTGAKTE
jgi:hypothetical protein